MNQLTFHSHGMPQKHCGLFVKVNKAYKMADKMADARYTVALLLLFVCQGFAYSPLPQSASTIQSHPDCQS